MKLTDLNPAWVRILDDEGRSGIRFDCPVHRGKTNAHGETCRLHVFFEPTLDGAPLHGNLRWARTGDTFETLTLTPSIDASMNTWFDGVPCWHGHITNGEAVP